MTMAEENGKSLSVIIPTNSGNELTKLYLPQLCAHIEECDGITDYEVVVSDTSTALLTDTELTNLPNVRYLRFDGTAGEVANLNNALFAATKDYVLIINKTILPSHNYFSELMKLFNYMPSLFGVSGNTLVPNTDERPEGPKTIDDNKSGIAIKTITTQSKRPTYTLALQESNMVIERKHLCMMGGFSNLYNRIDYANADICIKAWRSGKKCLYAPLAYCKKLQLNENDNQPQKETLRENNILYDQVLLNYIHTSRFSHLLFWIRLLSDYFRTLVVKDATTKANRTAYNQFFGKFWKIFTSRRWAKKQRNEPFDKIAKGFFSGNQLQELSYSE